MRDEEKIILGILVIAIPVVYVATRGEKTTDLSSKQPPRAPPPGKTLEIGGESGTPMQFESPTHSTEKPAGGGGSAGGQAPLFGQQASLSINQQRQNFSRAFYQQLQMQFAAWEERRSDYVRRKRDVNGDISRIEAKTRKRIVLLPVDIREQLVKMKDITRHLGRDLGLMYPRIQQFIGQLHPVRGEIATANTFQSMLTQLTKEMSDLAAESNTISHLLDQDHLARTASTQPINVHVPQIQVPQPQPLDLSKLEGLFSQKPKWQADTEELLKALQKKVDEMSAATAFFQQSKPDPLPKTSAHLLGREGTTAADLEDIKNNKYTPSYNKPDGTSHVGKNSSFDVAASNKPSTSQPKLNDGVDKAKEINQRNTGKRSAERVNGPIGNPDSSKDKEKPTKAWVDPFDMDGS